MNNKQTAALEALRDVMKEHDISVGVTESYGDMCITLDVGGEVISDDLWGLGDHAIDEILNENKP